MNTVNKNLLRCVPIIVAACFTGCGGGTSNGEDGLNSLVNLVTLEAGDECATGGVKVQSGKDSNKNDTLDDDEIVMTKTVCAGTNGAQGVPGAKGTNGMVTIADVAEGGATCPSGGKAYHYGIDENASGVLDATEISDTQYVCRAANQVELKSTEPPAGPAPQYSIKAKGGVGNKYTNSNGGNGGAMSVSLDTGSRTGHVKIFKTGQADASFSFPAEVKTFLGANPLIVTTATVVKTYASGVHDNAVEGEFHTHTSERLLYKWAGGKDTQVTGIDIQSGTLKFELNFTDYADVVLNHDIINAGTITTEWKQPDAIHRGDLRISASTYYGLPGSSFDLTGKSLSGEQAGNGGYLSLNMYSENTDASHQGEGAVYNQSTVNTSGGKGSVGGAAGPIYLYGNLAVLNTGDLSARGGESTAGMGESGGQITLNSQYGNCSNSGLLDSSGGTGTNSGGDADRIEIYTSGSGDVRNTGNLVADGGQGGSSSGGSAAAIEIGSGGGSVSNSGNISARGGGSSQLNGGRGGMFELYYYYDADSWSNGIQGARDFSISGNIDLSGGDGNTEHINQPDGYGGNAGSLSVNLDAGELPKGQEIIFLGYNSIDLSGGDGTSGGDGGGVSLANSHSYQSFDFFSTFYGASGGVFNHVDVVSNGGTGFDGPGGAGGFVLMETGDEPYEPNAEWMVTRNYGALTLNGGDGTIEGGNSGGVNLWGYFAAENHGALVTNGGASSVLAGSGGSSTRRYGCGQVLCRNGVNIIAGQGAAINTAIITASGGSAIHTASVGGSESGGAGGNLQIVGTNANNTGTISVTGGDATQNDPTDIGGSGGDIFIYGMFDGADNSGTLAVAGGLASVHGAKGEVYINGMNVTDDY